MRRGLILFALFTFFIPSLAYSSCVEVFLSRSVRISGSEVRLGDVARSIVGGVGLRDVVLGYAPPPGQWMSMKKSYIAARVRQVVSVGNVKVEGPDEVKVFRAARIVGKRQLLRIARKFILGALPGNKVVIKSLKVVPSSLRLPEGRLSYRCSPPSSGSLLGLKSFPITFYVNGKREAQVWVHSEVKLVMPVVVAVRPLVRGEVIGDDDVALEKRELSGTDCLFRLSDAVGKRVRVSIPPGTALTRKLLVIPPVIKVGDRVSIVAEKGGLRVSVPGEARQSGRVGDVIRVRNLMSKKTVFARVVNGEEVKVDFQ